MRYYTFMPLSNLVFPDTCAYCEVAHPTNSRIKTFDIMTSNCVAFTTHKKLKLDIPCCSSCSKKIVILSILVFVLFLATIGLFIYSFLVPEQMWLYLGISIFLLFVSISFFAWRYFLVFRLNILNIEERAISVSHPSEHYISLLANLHGCEYYEVPRQFWVSG